MRERQQHFVSTLPLPASSRLRFEQTAPRAQRPAQGSPPRPSLYPEYLGHGPGRLFLRKGSAAIRAEVQRQEKVEEVAEWMNELKTVQLYGWEEAHRARAMAEAEAVARKVRALQRKYGLSASADGVVGSHGSGYGYGERMSGREAEEAEAMRNAEQRGEGRGGGADGGGPAGGPRGRDPQRTLQVRIFRK